MTKLKVSKAAIAASTAVLMVSSLFTPVISASSANELSLTPNTYEIKPGQRLAVSLDYSPSDTGVAGFTVAVHYDPDMMDVYVPDSGSLFSLIANNEENEGYIKLVAADMGGTNVDKSGNVATLYFDIKDTAQGDLNYWIDVENMIADGSSGYANADYSVPTQSSPVTVKVDAPYDTELLPSEPDPEEEPEEEKPEEVKQPEQQTEQPKAEEAVKTEQKAAEQAADTEEKEQTQLSGEALYTYDQSQDNSGGAVQYVFNINDYTDKQSGTADIEVKLSSNGTVNGAVGLGTTAGEWQSFVSSTSGGETVWKALGVDLASLNGTAAVQFYYVQDDVTVEEIKISVDGADNAEEAVRINADVNDTDDGVISSESGDEEDDDKDVLTADADDTEDTDIDDNDVITDDNDDDDDADTENAGDDVDEDDDDEDADDEDADAEDDEDSDEEVSETSEALTSDGKLTTLDNAADVEGKVAAAADQAKSNPQTGEQSDKTAAVRILLMVLSGCILVYSGVAIALNKFVFGKKED